MNPSAYPHRARAAQIVVLCCALWAFSFPGTKALQYLAEQTAPGISSVFHSAFCIVLRFGLSGVIVWAMLGGSLRGLTRLEWKQGLGLGCFGSMGMLFQLDGLAHTTASISAFLTQAYCVLIPIWFAVIRRSSPSFSTWGACFLACAGVAILLGVRLDEFKIGRGELETLIGSVMFAAQILWLERPEFVANNVLRFTWVMFNTMALINLPIAVFTARNLRDFTHSFHTPQAMIILGILIFLCTVATFLLVNRWQRELPATEAGLLYCTEPVFTSLLCLWIPEVLSRTAGLHYPNEKLTQNLLVGGLLILAANAWLQLRPPPDPTPKHADSDPRLGS